MFRTTSIYQCKDLYGFEILQVKLWNSYEFQWLFRVSGTNGEIVFSASVWCRFMVKSPPVLFVPNKQWAALSQIWFAQMQDSVASLATRLVDCSLGDEKIVQDTSLRFKVHRMNYPQILQPGTISDDQWGMVMNTDEWSHRWLQSPSR